MLPKIPPPVPVFDVEPKPLVPVPNPDEPNADVWVFEPNPPPVVVLVEPKGRFWPPNNEFEVLVFDPNPNQRTQKVSISAYVKVFNMHRH